MNRRGFFAAILAAVAAPVVPNKARGRGIGLPSTVYADASSQTLDAAIYRFAFDGGVIYYPEDVPVRRNRDVCVSLAEWHRAAKG